MGDTTGKYAHIRKIRKRGKILILNHISMLTYAEINGKSEVIEGAERER